MGTRKPAGTRLWAPPGMLVDRVRWIFLLITLLSMVTTVPGVVMSRTAWLAPALVASIALPALWVRAYRSGITWWNDGAQTVGLLVIGMACKEPSWDLNLVYVMPMYLALFGSNVNAAARTLSYVGVMEVLVSAHPIVDPMMKPGMLAAWLVPSLALSTLSMRALAVVIERQQQAASRARILAEAGEALLRARNASAVRELAVEVIGRLLPEPEHCHCWLVSGPVEERRVVNSWPKSADTDIPTSPGTAVRSVWPLNGEPNADTQLVLDHDRDMADGVRDSVDMAIAQISLAMENALLQEQLAHRANHDFLTTLPNRRSFIDHLHMAWSGSSLDPRLAVLFIDLDDFKTVNDGMGHEAGDELLSAVAARLDHGRRAGDLVARLGGDEFAVLLHEVEDAAEASAVAVRLLESLEAPFSIAGRAVHARSSVGVATSQTAANPEDLVRNADVAMYVAKALGKGRYQVFSPEMHDDVTGELRKREEFERVLERKELVVYYQPIIDLDTHRTSGFEALVRWQHPQRGLVLPGEFIPLAERSGAIIDLERWVLTEATRQAASWPASPEGLEPRLSVNLSARHIQHPDVVDHVMEALEASGLDPRRLLIEVTEEVLLQDRESGIRHLNALKRIGVGLALDDFGTGYSSLSYLDQLPVDTIKIDRSFIDDTRWPFVTAILDMTRALQIETVAEGVEVTEHDRWLSAAGCRRAQGFHYARPMPAADVAPWLSAAPDLLTAPQLQ